jgi:ribosome-associated heat shock protein Hsp15
VAGGKVQVNGTRGKPGKQLRVGDALRVRVGPYDWLVTVRAVTERRGSGRDAQLLYDESVEGRAARERLAEAHRMAPTPTYQGKGRPTKKDRRRLELL